MDRIRELLGKLKELTAEELVELRTLILAQAEEVEAQGTTPETVAVLNELADAGEQVMAESSAREAAQAQAEADAEAARQRIAAISGEPAAEGEGEGEGTEGVEGEGESEGAEGEPAAVAASGTVGRMAGRAAPPTPSPEANEPARNRAVLTAAGAMRGINAGETIEDRSTLGRGLAETLRRMPREGASRGDVIVASATWEYPPERQLTDDQERNAELIDAVVHPTALVATGGICAPTNVDYAIPTWATADRPLRDGLPSFQATRGGLRFVQPPDIGALAAASGIWTAATDANPGAATKPLLTVACGSEVQVLVDAITTRLGFGNMQSRFAPEQVAANTDLAIAAAARIAENNLLAKLQANSVAGVTNTVLLGATRDLITVIDQAVAAYRWFHRLASNTVFTAVFPEWLKSIIRTDLAREIGHEQNAQWNSLSISDAQVEGLLRDHGVNPIWHLDGQPSPGGAFPLQGFAAQAAGAVNAYPAKVVWYLFPEGTFQFLDGGRLDLGVVRDSTLDATNDYETFVETFEAVAFRGFANGSYQMITSLCANGGSAGTISTAGSCA